MAVLDHQTERWDWEAVGGHWPPLMVGGMSEEESPGGCVGRQDCR